MISRQNIVLTLCHIVFLGYSIYLIWIPEVFPGIDYIDFLIRMHIFNVVGSDVVYSEFFEKNFAIVPYMAFPVFMIIFEPILGMIVTGKLFLLLCLILAVSGTMTLNYALYGKIRFWTILTYPFFFNFVLSFGFVNFLLSSGLVLISFSIWLMHKNKTWLFYTAFAFLSIFIFYCHIFGFVMNALLIGIYETFEGQSILDIKAHLKKIIPAFFKVLSFSIVPILLFTGVENFKTEYGTITYFGSVDDRIAVFLTPGYFTHQISNILFIVLLFFLFIFEIVKIEKLKNTLIVLTVVAMITPTVLLSVAFVHIRLPVLIAFLLTASMGGASKFSFPTRIHTNTIKGMFIFCLFLIVCLLKMLDTHNSIVVCDSMFHEYRTALDNLKSEMKGKKMLTVLTQNNSDCGTKGSFTHVSTFAAYDAKMFVPEIMTGTPPTIKAKEKYKLVNTDMDIGIFPEWLVMSPDDALEFQKKVGLSRLYWQNWRKDFDYVTYFHHNNPVKMEDNLKEIERGSYFSIYKIEKNENL